MNYPTAIVVATALIAAATVSVNLPAAQPAQGNPGQAKDALQKRMKLKNVEGAVEGAEGDGGSVRNWRHRWPHGLGY